MKQVSNCFMVAQKCARSLEKKKIKEYIYSVHTLDNLVLAMNMAKSISTILT